MSYDKELDALALKICYPYIGDGNAHTVDMKRVNEVKDLIEPLLQRVEVENHRWFKQILNHAQMGGKKSQTVDQIIARVDKHLNGELEGGDK